jgi:phosphatidyl-myo-inositol alpha-mannosyltransferase
MAWRERREVRRAQVVHVELGGNDGAGFWYALATGMISKRMVLVAHDPPPIVKAPAAALIRRRAGWRDRIAYRILSPLFDRPLRAWLLRQSRAVVVFSEAARDQVSARAPVIVIDHGADPPPHTPTPPGESRYALYAGYIGPSKGIDTLLAAWRIAERELPFDLVIAGAAVEPGQERQLHLAAAACTRPPRFAGYVDEPSFSRLFAHAALVVVPYRSSNPASGIVLRAVAAGRPVLGTAVPAVKSTIRHGVSGLIVPTGDADALAEGLRRLANPALRDRLGQGAADTGRRHSWPHHVDGLMRAYAAAGGRQ